MSSNSFGSNRARRLARSARRGAAIVPALMVVSLMLMLGLSMVSAGLSGSRAVEGQADEFRLESAVESAGTLAADAIWAGYLRSQGGAAGSIASFRGYLATVGLTNTPGTGAPEVGAGIDLRPRVALPSGAGGASELDQVTIDALRAVRRDVGESTRLYVSVQATSKRGQGLARTPVKRAVQLVYDVQPAPFEGFDYGILTNNVNCVFCHTSVDSVDRVYNHDPSHYGSFAKVKVGTLQSLMLRTDARPGIGDWDADSTIAGTLYVRGHATNQNGVPLTSWGGYLSFHSQSFDGDGHLVQDPASGALTTSTFSPATMPLAAGANLYLNYPTDYSAMVDGKLPIDFPPPFPDDGGTDPTTGFPSGGSSAGNKKVDPLEFATEAANAHGSISGGVLTVLGAGSSITTSAQLSEAFGTGNTATLGSVTTGNVVLTGTIDNPIRIDGTVAIDGDVVINGWVKGEGVVLARGNMYVPGDLRYLDGHEYAEGDSPGHPTGPVTFGVGADGTKNALGLACGGNMLLGDYLMPSPSLSPGANDIVTGSSDGAWNFPLAEMSLFNRNEWAKTQPMLPGHGDDVGDPSTWHVTNPNYVAGYVPRYYQFGPGDAIPIYNLGNIWFDPSSGTWRGDSEVPLSWDSSKLTMVNPADTSNPILYDPSTGAPRAAVLTVSPENGWISDEQMKAAINGLVAARPEGQAVQVDGLLYTNNAIFGIVPRSGRAQGQLLVNGSLVCPDLGLLAPGNRAPAGVASPLPGSSYQVGLQLNYDRRTKGMLNVTNPYSVVMHRALWRPAATLM